MEIINKKNFSILSLLFAVSGILSMNPYFVWKTFGNGNYLVYIIYIVTILFSLPLIISKKYKTSFMFINIGLIFILFILLYLHVVNNTIKRIVGGILSIFVIFCFLLMPSKEKLKTFNYFTKCFVISLIPGFCYFLLYKLGIDVSIEKITSPNIVLASGGLDFFGNDYYLLFFGGVIRVYSNTRFSGIYDEAGLVGTVCSLLLIAKNLKFKHDFWAYSLAFFLLFSFSLAGYILIFVGIILKLFRRYPYRTILLLLFFYILLYFVILITNSFQNIPSLSNRFYLDGPLISIVNNRNTSHFEIGFAEFTNSSLITHLFGFGAGSSNINQYMVGSSSYKILIYCYGYVGSSLILGIFIYNFLTKKRSFYQYILLFCFILSIYQRPSVMYLFYFIILFGGVDNVVFLENYSYSKQYRRLKNI